MLSPDEIREQQALLATHRRTLAIYLSQQASIGAAFSPPGLINSIHATRHQIQHIKALLRTAGAAIIDDPDDDPPPEPPPLPPHVTANRSHTPLLLAVIGTASLIFAGIAAGLILPRLFARNPNGAAVTTTVAPGSTAAAPAPNPAAPAPADERLFRFSFQNGVAAGWNGEPAEWRVIAAGDRYVYQATAGAAATASTPPNVHLLAQLNNYAIETRVRVAQPGPTTDDLADFWITARAQPQAGENCAGYSFFVLSETEQGAISVGGGNACPFTFLTYAPISFASGRWHTIRIELAGEELRLLIDNTLALEARDDRLREGFFYFSVGPGATVEFDDVTVYRLAH
jgi:hypothetical protein